MSEIGIGVKAINLSSTTPWREKKGVTAEKTPQKALSSSSAEDEDGSPIRHIACVKNKVDVKHFEGFSKLSVSDNGGGGGGGSPDIAVVAEKGQVACRDYPHSRHLCLKFPFETTPHESYCELCYCYVCDSSAPCGLWKLSHCHAAAHIGDWKCKRMMKQQAAVKK
ncbi:unnamed protein product [Malus baccata var. baccata]